MDYGTGRILGNHGLWYW